MKKILASALALIMLVALCIPAYAADTLVNSTIKEQFQVIKYDGRVDVADGKNGKFTSPSTKIEGKSLGAVYWHTDDCCLTDGIVCMKGALQRSETDTSKAFVYQNKSWTGSTNENLSKANDDFEHYALETFELVPGTKYLYYYEVNGFKADVDGFAVYLTGDYEAAANKWNGDAEFDVVVSTDEGKTWTVAWSSVKFTKTAEAVTAHAWFEKSEGGNSTKVEVKDGEKFVTSYYVIDEKFNKVYKNATNVAVAVKKARVSSSAPFNPFYYAARYSELDVFAAPKSESTADTSLFVGLVLAGAVALTGSVAVIRKRKEEI